MDALQPRDRMWPAPYADRMPSEVEYSRCLDPGKYQVLHERLQLWAAVVVKAGLGRVEAAQGAVWRDLLPERDLRAATPTATWWLRPSSTSALPLLVVAHRQEGGVWMGAGDPAVPVVRLPVCGCDACDDGGALLAGELDDRVLDVLGGSFTHVRLGDARVVGVADGWSTNSDLAGQDVERLLAEARSGRSPHHVVHGTPWG
ncbi:hypothetical protein GCM10027519_20390 [Kineococcus endophyticus]